MPEAKILVVDDEANIRLFLAETLSGEGHQVTAAASGEEALPLIVEQDFDLALLDLMLPGMSGIEFLAILRQHRPDTVVIIMTAHGTLETAVEAMRQGALDYLFKPCKTMQLRESVRQGLLKRERELNQRRLLHQLEQYLASQLENIRATLTGVAPPVSPIMSPPPLPDASPTAAVDRFLKYGGLLVDLAGHIITLNGHLLELSPTEFDLLAYLVSEAPRVISPQELVQAVQGYSGERWEARDMVRQHIFNIRQKIKETTGLTEVIRNVRGVGYALFE